MTVRACPECKLSNEAFPGTATCHLQQQKKGGASHESFSNISLLTLFLILCTFLKNTPNDDTGKLAVSYLKSLVPKRGNVTVLLEM